MKKWCVMRIRPQLGRDVEKRLQELQVEHYIPFCKQTVERDGRRFSVEKIASLNFIFVHLSLTDCVQLYQQMHCYCAAVLRSDGSHQVLTVPDKQMADFRFLMDFSQEAVQVFNDNLKPGQHVRVVKGPFAGIEGELIRIKGHKRVVVRLEGVFSLATTYIPGSFLEVIG